MSKAFELEMLYEEIYLDGLQDQVIAIIGSDNCILGAIADLDYEFRAEIRRLEKLESEAEWAT